MASLIEALASASREGALELRHRWCTIAQREAHQLAPMPAAQSGRSSVSCEHKMMAVMHRERRALACGQNRPRNPSFGRRWSPREETARRSSRRRRALREVG